MKGCTRSPCRSAKSRSSSPTPCAAAVAVHEVNRGRSCDCCKYDDAGGRGGRGRGGPRGNPCIFIFSRSVLMWFACQEAEAVASAVVDEEEVWPLSGVALWLASG